MSTNNEEPQAITADGPDYGVWTEEHAARLAAEGVSYLTNALEMNREQLDIKRRARKRIKAALEIARAREASEPKSIPTNPGWGSFGFNVRFPGEDGRVWPAAGYQFGGEISVVAGKDYWFFESWDDMILWMRDTEKVKAVSRIWKMEAVPGSTSVTVR